MDVDGRYLTGRMHKVTVITGPCLRVSQRYIRGSNRCHIGSKEVFVHVLDTPHIAGEFRVDVTGEDNQEQRRIWNNPLIVHHATSDIVLPPIIETTIFWISILIQSGLLTEWLWKVFATLAILHAGCIVTFLVAF